MSKSQNNKEPVRVGAKAICVGTPLIESVNTNNCPFTN